MDNSNRLAYITALYVEDDDMTREELSKFLKRRVGKLYVAKNGEEGLDTFMKLEPDLLITDIKMSPRDGLSMATEIRARGFKTPIIITSALSDTEAILEAVDIGIVKYVIKPVDTEKLLRAIIEVSEEILLKKGQIVSKNNLYDREEIKELEKVLKTKISTFIKLKTGKGPRNITIAISGNKLKIILKGSLTQLELSLISKGKNFKIVNFSRETFYKEHNNELENIVLECMSRKVELERSETDSSNDIDQLEFIIMN